MKPRLTVHRLALLLLGSLAASCADSAGTTTPDATVPVDVGAANDLSSDRAETTADASPNDTLDSGADATVDRPDVFSPWGDAPLVDLGGILIPVDPNAVPLPGSECTGDAGARMGDPTVAPPRPIRPLSVSRVTSQRPTFQWVLREGTTGARVEVCADRCCTRVIQSFDAEGTTARPMTPLPPGVVFWRMFGRRGTVVGSRASYTWEFGVRRRDAPNDTTWGTIRDFNGDGFDDVMVFRPVIPSRGSSALLLLPGSTDGLRRPITTSIVTISAPIGARVGDLNGDGLADLVWADRDSNIPTRSWVTVVAGSTGELRSMSLPDVSLLGECAITRGGQVTDWNGDGYSDVIVDAIFGCNFLEPVRASFLAGYLGSASGIAAVPQWAIRLDGRFMLPLVGVNQGAGSGDIDRDGYGDVFISSSFSGGGTTSIPDERAVLHGVAEGDPTIERVPPPEPIHGDWGDALPATIGDLDGDGFLESYIRFNSSNPILIYGHVQGWARPAVELIDPVRGSYFGSYISSGDINGDGFADVIVSSETATTLDQDGNPENVGRVYVFPGSSTGPSEPVWVERMRGSKDVTVNHFGASSMSPGDINGDGVDDVIMFDALHRSLCVRYGRMNIATGSPDACLEGVVRPDSWIY